MCRSLSGVAPMIIWVDCPAGAKRGVWRYSFNSCLDREMPSRICFIGAKRASFFLVRCQKGQTFGTGQFDIDAQPVGEQAQLVGEEGIGPRNGLSVDIASKAVLCPQQVESLNHQFGGIVRIPNHS